MSEITTELVKELRDATGISVMQCRRALEEAGGEMKKALAILKETSANIALKKKDREVKNGRVVIKSNDKKSILLALRCETDFVARNEDFINLLDQLANKALAEGVEKMKMDAKEMIDAVIQKTGENISLGEIYELEGLVLGNYVHNNKLAAIVSLVGGNKELAKDIAMHVAAMQPEDIPELLGQAFIKNSEETVGVLLEKNKATIKEIKKYSI